MCIWVGNVGTGKTKTIVALLRTLTAQGLMVHATAPTNVAVCEIARRTLSSFDDKASDYLQPLRLSNLLLIGNKSRLKIEDGDPLNTIFLESRIERLAKAIGNLPVVLDSFSRWTSVQQVVPDDENGSADVKMDVVNAFKSKINDFEIILQVFDKEAPCNMRRTLSESKLLSLNQAYDSLRMESDSCLLEWLLSNVEEKRKNRAIMLSCSTIRSFFQSLYSSISTLRVDQLKEMVIKEASLIYSTVNGGGRKVFDLVFFDVCVVDEATQLVEAELAIVLREQLRCLVLVGDEKQLPSTVISSVASKLGYGESLFDRLLKLKFPYSILNTQYRMHPKISEFPRLQFYDSRVINGDNVMSPDYEKSWHHFLPPLSIYDVRFGNEEADLFGSKYNETEAMIVRQISGVIRQNIVGPVSVSILSPYAAQVARLSHLENSVVKDMHVRVCTIDGFQGQESDIIIFSAVRSNKKNKIGFLSDLRRLNVAITRARFSLIIVCNVNTVSENTTWDALISHATEVGAMRTFKDCDIIQRSRQVFLNSVNRLKSILEGNDEVFESAPWQVVFTGDFRAKICKSDTDTQKAIMRKIIALAHGEWPKFEFINRDVDEDFQEVIHVYRMSQLKLIWSVDVASNCTQYLKVWDIVSNESNSMKTIRRVTSVLNTYSPEYIDRCSAKQKNSENKFKPQLWKKDENFVWHKPKKRQTVGEVDLERSSVSNSAVLTKFYPLNSGIARLLMMESEKQRDMELPFEMSEEEESIVRHVGSMLVLGRSGTGKVIFLNPAFNN